MILGITMYEGLFGKLLLMYRHISMMVYYPVIWRWLLQQTHPWKCVVHLFKVCDCLLKMWNWVLGGWWIESEFGESSEGLSAIFSFNPLSRWRGLFWNSTKCLSERWLDSSLFQGKLSSRTWLFNCQRMHQSQWALKKYVGIFSPKQLWMWCQKMLINRKVKSLFTLLLRARSFCTDIELFHLNSCIQMKWMAFDCLFVPPWMNSCLWPCYRGLHTRANINLCLFFNF